MGNSQDEIVSFELAENLVIHHLDVTPKESEQAIEFTLHGEIEDLDASRVQQAAGSRLKMETLTCSVTDTEQP